MNNETVGSDDSELVEFLYMKDGRKSGPFLTPRQTKHRPTFDQITAPKMSAATLPSTLSSCVV
jgi:hypothetical protein